MANTLTVAPAEKATDPIAHAAPILVTGIARAGTSWVGKMLQASGRTVYLNEPLNIRHPDGLFFRRAIACRYPYITRENEAEYLDTLQALLRLEPPLWRALRQTYWPGDLLRSLKYSTDLVVGGIRGQQALLKDPYAALSMIWFSQRLGCHVAALVRHPAAIVGSRKKLGWKTGFEHLLEQKQLCDEWLGPFVGGMKEMLQRPDDIIGQSSLWWRIIYYMVAEQKKLLPSIEVVRYEDLASEPLSEFERLYPKLGLPMSEATRVRIQCATSGQSEERSFTWSVSATNVSRTSFRPMDSRASATRWKRNLTPAELSRIRSLTEDVAHAYYSDRDWM